MKNPINLYLDPNQFFREFSPDLTQSLMAKYTRTKSGEVPAQQIFCIMRIEDIGKHIKFPIPIGRSTVYEICWLKEGTMVSTNGLVKYEIKKNNIALWRAGTLKGTDSLTADAKGYYCLFDKDFVLPFLKTQASLDDLPFFRDNGRTVVTLSKKDNTAIKSLLDKLDREFLGDLPERERLMGLMLCELLITSKRYSSEEIDHEGKSSGELLTKKFMEAIKIHAKQQRGIQFYADLLNVTANYLNKCVKTYTGKPATYHIVTRLILEAKIMLRQTQLSISEIAIELGFEDTSYFSRMFHKNTGMTAKKYKNQAAEAEKE